MTSRRFEESELAMAYLEAKTELLAAGYSDELDWQAGVCLSKLTESTFLREAAWVVLGSGFREAIVRAVFPRVSEAFFEWRSASLISRSRTQCVADAVRWFANVPKLEAIAEIAARVARLEFAEFRSDLAKHGPSVLIGLPYLGPVTSLHLAKNIGLQVAKPDRHLRRVSELAGRSPDELCAVIAGVVGDSVGVVDLVLWRMSVVSPGYWEGRLKGALDGWRGP